MTGSWTGASAGGGILWIFDLDHTLVHSPLDLDAVRAEVRDLLRASGVIGPGGGPAAPSRPEPLARLLEAAAAYDARHGTDVAARAWQTVTRHELRAVAGARPVEGAAATLAALRARGDGIAVWTNNARVTAARALERSGLAPLVDRLVTRDESGRLKPDPAGFRVIRAWWEASPSRRQRWRRAVMVGDSWIDGAAAAAAGLPFIGFRLAGPVTGRPVPVWRRIGQLTELLEVARLSALPEALARGGREGVPPDRPDSTPAGAGTC